MRRPPRSKSEPMLNTQGLLLVLALGSYIGLVTLWLFHYYLDHPDRMARRAAAFLNRLAQHLTGKQNIRAQRTDIQNRSGVMSTAARQPPMLSFRCRNSAMPICLCLSAASPYCTPTLS